MSNNVSQSPSFDLSKTPPKLTNNHVLIKHNNNRSTKRSRKSYYNNNMLNDDSNTTSYSSNNNNNKPMKVVHISNPIRFQATPAEFRALVQGLTGRDAVVDDRHFFGMTHQAAVVDNDHESHELDDIDHHQGTGGGATSSSNDNTSDDDNINNNKVLFDNNNYCYDHNQDSCQQQQQEVNMSAGCFGPSDHLSFDYYEAFNNDGCEFVFTEDLRAFMDAYGQ